MKLKLTILAALFLIAVAAQGQIQSSFFGMGVVAYQDLPKVTYGVMSHPPLAWTAIEGKGRGVFDFTLMDPYVKAAPKDVNGVALIDLVMGWTPGWAASSTQGCINQRNGVVACTSAPEDLQDWTDFISEVANHYNGVTAPQVKYYEVWNEANTIPFWTGTVTQLIQMGELAYPILKQNRYSSVLTPSVVWTPSGTGWMAEYLSGGGANAADGVSFHGYPSKTGRGVALPVPLPGSSSSTNAPIQTMIAGFRGVADSNGMSGKPLITTEGGWGVNGVSDPDMQAAWITQYEILQAGLAATDKLAMQTWYTWGQAPSGTIETTTGKATPAGLAYQEVMTKWLLKSIPSPCTNSGNLWSCPVGRKLIMWDASQTCSNGVCTTEPYTPPKGYLQYIDLTGAVHAISGTIDLGVKPILMQP
ncbi:MAG: hypothetical protein WAN03_02495 [Candidatus Sulfotelmatobacter sp.]